MSKTFAPTRCTKIRKNWPLRRIVKSRISPSSDPLKYHGDSLADADAHGREPKLGVSVVHGMDQRRGNASPGCTKRVADRDPAAADIYLRFVHFEHANTGDRLGGKGLIELDQIDILKREAGPLECFLGGGHRA